MKKLVIWSEEDATSGMHDHDRLRGAIERMFGIGMADDVLRISRRTDRGGVLTHELKVTIISRHSGNDSIVAEPMP